MTVVRLTVVVEEELGVDEEVEEEDGDVDGAAVVAADVAVVGTLGVLPELVWTHETQT